MISVIYGAKGTGKTKRIFAAANSAAERCAGHVIFITDNGQSLGLDHNIRFVNLSEYAISGKAEFIGFLKGMLATNFDIEEVFIDGISRLLALPAEKLKPIFNEMAKVADKVNFVVTVSTDELPKFLKQYAVKD